MKAKAQFVANFEAKSLPENLLFSAICVAHTPAGVYVNVFRVRNILKIFELRANAAKIFYIPRRCHWAELINDFQPFSAIVNLRAESPTYFSPTASPRDNIKP